MKKAIALVTVVSALAANFVPAFAASNNGGSITINGGKGNNTVINQTNNYTTNNINLTDIGGHWAEKYIKDLVKKGVLSGDDKHKFNPNGAVTRGQYAVMVARYFDLANTSTTQDFNDVPTNSWAYPYVEATKDYFDKYKDLNGGYDFKPAQGAAREDVTYTLIKILTKLDPSVQLMDSTSANALLALKFDDYNKITPSLRPYVATAVKYGLINGDGKGHFLPDKVLTRAEAATLLDRLQDSGVVVDEGSTTVTGGTADTGSTTDTGSTIDNGGTTENGSTN